MVFRGCEIDGAPLMLQHTLSDLCPLLAHEASVSMWKVPGYSTNMGRENTDKEIHTHTHTLAHFPNIYTMDHMMASFQNKS